MQYFQKMDQILLDQRLHKPNVIPNVYKLKNKRSRGKPKFKIETKTKEQLK